MEFRLTFHTSIYLLLLLMRMKRVRNLRLSSFGGTVNTTAKRVQSTSKTQFQEANLLTWQVPELFFSNLAMKIHS